MEKRNKVAIGRTFEPTGEVLDKGFNASWGSYYFDEYDAEELLKGNEIRILSDNDNMVTGYLAKMEYKGNEFWGFKLGIPDIIAGHEITSTERKALYGGDKLLITDFWSPKKCRNFTAYIEWDGDNIIMEYTDAVPEEKEKEKQVDYTVKDDKSLCI